jgi:carboxyl-terminal processing protease
MHLPAHMPALRRALLLGALLACGPALAQGKSSEPMPSAQLQALAQVYDLLRHTLPDPAGGDKLVVGAIRGLVREADPEGGEYFTEEEFKLLRSGPSGGPAGIGVELVRRGYSTVVMPLAGNAAEAAGLRVGDVLLAIDGKPVHEMGQQEAVNLLRGAAGSKVRLRLLREFAAQPVEVEIERQIVVRRSLSLTRADADVAVLTVHAFHDRLLEDLARQLREQWAQQPWRGLVLDLRGNMGGAVSTAIGLAALFLPERAVIAKMSGRQELSNQTFRAVASDYKVGGQDPLKPVPAALRERPMVVLVDGGTAAAAEIVTAALKDHGRATVIGRTTFGRGSVQTVTPLHGHGAVKLTTAYWESPAGARIHKVGVPPDEALAPGLSAAQELGAAMAALKKRL